MEVENITIGQVYYVTSKSDCKQCFRVKVVAIIDDRSVEVTSLSSKMKKPKIFTLPIKALHSTPNKAVKGFKQHH